MEVDTGAAYSVISNVTYKASFSDIKLRKSDVLLKTYTNERIRVIGQLNANVAYSQQKAALVLLVVAGKGPALIGRD